MAKLSVKLKKYQNQLLAALASNLIGFLHGMMLGWMSPTLYLLHSENSPFDRPPEPEEVSWIGSSISLGGFTGGLIFGLMIDRIGRKKALLLLPFPNFCGWITIYLSSEFYHLYIARFLSGLTGGGLYAVVPIFVAEIADNDIRGSLGSMLLCVCNVGMTFGYCLSSYLPFRLVPLVILWIPVVYIILVLCLPETPRYLLINGKEINAEMSYKFYKNFKGETKEEFQAFTKGFQELKDSLESSMSKDSKITAKDFFNPLAIKGIIIGVVIVIFNQITGCFVILNYSSKIFFDAGVTLDPNLCTILMGVVQIIGTYLATMTVDKCGRKPLFNLSLFGMFLGLATTGLFDYFKSYIDLSNFSWIPIVSVSFVVFAASFGVNPLPILIIVEIIPGKIRSYVSMGCLLVLSSTAFMCLKVFPILLEVLNLYGVMCLCAGFSIAGMLFVIFFIDETKGKVLQENTTHSKPIEVIKC